jgi:diaminohydroxyphosphoribosylaminopyrimidine deaminase/5-amino-6-(5-phosphoribosylamino)uracil reductase
MHRQRAEVDAIAVGADTVLVDDPLLTARLCYRYRPLTRVVFDWRLRVPPAARLFSTLSAGPVIMMVTAEAARARAAHVAALRDRGVEFDVYESRAIPAALGRLAQREIQSLLVEGGPSLHRAFLESRAADRVQWIVTPAILVSGVAAWEPARYGIDLARADCVSTAGGEVLLEIDVHRTD